MRRSNSCHTIIREKKTRTSDQHMFNTHRMPRSTTEERDSLNQNQNKTKTKPKKAMRRRMSHPRQLPPSNPPHRMQQYLGEVAQPSACADCVVELLPLRQRRRAVSRQAVPDGVDVLDPHEVQRGHVAPDVVHVFVPLAGDLSVSYTHLTLPTTPYV